MSPTKAGRVEPVLDVTGDQRAVVLGDPLSGGEVDQVDAVELQDNQPIRARVRLWLARDEALDPAAR